VLVSFYGVKETQSCQSEHLRYRRGRICVLNTDLYRNIRILRRPLQRVAVSHERQKQSDVVNRAGADRNQKSLAGEREPTI